IIGWPEKVITPNLTIPMTTLSKNRGVHVFTISKAINSNLGMKSNVHRTRNLLTDKAKAISVERCPKLLNHLKHQGASKVVVFVEEKKFVVDAEINRQNSRVIAFEPFAVPPVLKTKNPASVMVFVAVASNGSIMPPQFVETDLKINTVEYVHILEEVLFPWMDEKFCLDNVVLIQDSAPYHGSKTTQTLLARKVPNFVKAQNWPSNNPDLSLLDYFLWGVLQERVNEHSHGSVDQLKASIIKKCKKIPASDVVAAARKFRARVGDVIEAKGGHIE
ncbi:Transposable element tcb2 transposase, partial [Caligus rogercresseyi]